MSLLKRIVPALCISIAGFFSYPVFADAKVEIPILCYHNFSPTTPGSMNMTPKKFESQMKWIKDNGYNIIPLSEAVAYLQGKKASIPPKAVVVTVDDGWKSAYTYMLPIINKYKIPVTLFIYPQTISHGKNAMTWEDLKELKKNPNFEIQAHTYSHPNFKQEKKHLSAAAYDKFVTNELVTSKKILDEKLGTNVTLLAWPFGIYNEYLEAQAKKAGYAMAFTIAALPADKSFRAMAQPRFMIIDGLSDKTFMGIVKRASSK